MVSNLWISALFHLKGRHQPESMALSRLKSAPYTLIYPPVGDEGRFMKVFRRWRKGSRCYLLWRYSFLPSFILKCHIIGRSKASSDGISRRFHHRLLYLRRAALCPEAEHQGRYDSRLSTSMNDRLPFVKCRRHSPMICYRLRCSACLQRFRFVGY